MNPRIVVRHLRALFLIPSREIHIGNRELGTFYFWLYRVHQYDYIYPAIASHYFTEICRM
jgi:hypothetical protein